MGFFSVNNRAPGAGQVMSNWAGEINQKNKAESYKKAGSELMQLFDALEGEDRVNPKKVNQVVASVWAKYPDLDQQDQRNIALMAKQAATEELKYKEYQQSQNDRARTEQDRITSKNDENAMATLLKNKYFPGSNGPQDDYDIDAPRGEGAATSDMVNNMSGKGIMAYLEEMNNAKTREQNDELFDLNKRKANLDINNAERTSNRMDVIHNRDDSKHDREVKEQAERDQAQKIIDRISAMEASGRGSDYRGLLAGQPEGVQRIVSEHLKGKTQAGRKAYYDELKEKSIIAKNNADAYAKLNPEDKTFSKFKKLGDLYSTRN